MTPRPTSRSHSAPQATGCPTPDRPGRNRCCAQHLSDRRDRYETTRSRRFPITTKGEAMRFARNRWLGLAAILGVVALVVTRPSVARPTAERRSITSGRSKRDCDTLEFTGARAVTRVGSASSPSSGQEPSRPPATSWRTDGVADRVGGAHPRRHRGRAGSPPSSAPSNGCGTGTIALPASTTRTTRPPRTADRADGSSCPKPAPVISPDVSGHGIYPHAARRHCRTSRHRHLLIP